MRQPRSPGEERTAGPCGGRAFKTTAGAVHRGPRRPRQTDRFHLPGGTQRAPKPATPGERSVPYLKAQDGIKETVDFTFCINVYFYFPKPWSSRTAFGRLTRFILLAVLRAPGTRLHPAERPRAGWTPQHAGTSASRSDSLSACVALQGQPGKPAACVRRRSLQKPGPAASTAPAPTSAQHSRCGAGDTGGERPLPRLQGP